MTSNPYAAPKAAVADAVVAPQGNFVPGGHGVPAGHGWDWVVAGWEMFKKQPGTWIGLVVVAAVIMIVLSFIPFIGPLALTVLWPVFAGGVLLGCRALDEGGALEIGHLFAGFRARFGTLAAVGAIYLAVYIAVIVVVGLITGVGMAAILGGDPGAGATTGALMTFLLALLIVAALMIPMAMTVWFAPALVTFHERDAVAAMKESFSGCLKNIVPFLLYGVVFLIAGIVASIPLGLGWLVLGPVLVASLYTAYRDIYFTS